MAPLHSQARQVHKVSDPLWNPPQMIVGQGPATATDERRHGRTAAMALFHLQRGQARKVSDPIWYLRQLIAAQEPIVATDERRRRVQLPWPRSTHSLSKFTRFPIDSGSSVNGLSAKFLPPPQMRGDTAVQPPSHFTYRDLKFVRFPIDSGSPVN